MPGLRGRPRAPPDVCPGSLKLLLDQNLSPRLAESLADAYSGTVHVRSVGLAAADDRRIWEYAARHGFVIATKDADFNQQAFVFGPPPKVVWICRGNCSTADIEQLLRERHADLLAFAANSDAALLALS